MSTEEITQKIGQISLDRPTDYVGRIEGRSTIFSMAVKPGSTAYRYDVTIEKAPDDPRRKKELTKQNDVGLRSVQRQICGDVIAALHTSTNGFGVQARYVYDGKRVLFTTQPIQLKRQKTRLAADQLPRRASVFLRNEPVDVEITPNERVHKLDYSDLQAALVADVSVQADRSIRTFLEILTSQFLINTNNYQYVTSGTLFETATTDLVDGMQMRVGIKKGVRISGDKGKPTAFLVLDMKRTAFFAQKKLSEIYAQFVHGPNDMKGKRAFEWLLRGIRCRVTYDTSKTMLFGSLSRSPVNDREYNVRGQSVPQYMQATKGINLQNPNWPGLHPDQPGGRKILYPLECLEVVEGQLVPVEKLGTKASQRLLLENSVAPDVRYTYVQQQLRKLATGDAAKFLAEFGVSVDINSNAIDINQRKAPKILVGGADPKKPATVTPQKNGSWFPEAKDAKFIVPTSKLKKWIVVADGVHPEQVKGYIQGLIQCATRSGMTLPPPAEYRQARPDQLEAIFKECSTKYQFIFFIGSDSDDSHAKLKLFEAYYKVLTQHVAIKNLKAGPQTVKNVVMKLNTKAFGLVYLPQIEQDMREYSLDCDDLLIIGLDVSHPQKLGAKENADLKKKHPELFNKHPSVVGVAANKMSHKWGFAGDYFYQQSRRESISPTRLRTSVSQLVTRFKEAGRTPKRVIVFRDGLSEGQLQQAAAEEFPSVKGGIKDVFPSLDTKITYIVATKDHNKRFYRQGGKGVENTAVGDVIDSKVVRTDVPEFYQQTHHPLKGVPKMMQLDTIVNELGMSMAQIQKMMVALTNMHQVCACPTSMPLPIYLAKETAKRGMANYNELYSMRFPARRDQRPSDFARQDIKEMDGIFDFDDLTARLSYHSSKLGSTRFNA